MKVLRPAIQGGLIGLAGGKGHPQGGFGAANDFFNQRRQMLLQQTMLQRQLQNDSQRNALEAARARYYDTRSGAYDTSQTAPVNPVAAPLRPGQMPSEAPPDLTPDNVPSQGSGVLSAKPQLRETDQGLMDISGTTATPVTTRVPLNHRSSIRAARRSTEYRLAEIAFRYAGQVRHEVPAGGRIRPKSKRRPNTDEKIPNASASEIFVMSVVSPAHQKTPAATCLRRSTEQGKHRF